MIEVGRKWSSISKKFKGARNEHMVKNRYMSLTKKYRKGKGKVVEETIHQALLIELGEHKTLKEKC